MMTFFVELKNPRSGWMLDLNVEADTAMEAINKAKAWNPGYSEMVSCQMVKGNY